MSNPYDSTAVKPELCPYCGCLPHQGGVRECPAIYKIEFYPDGTIKSVEKR